MKKWLLMIAGAMLITATAQADCGACEGAEKAKGKAACEMKKGADQAECAKDKAECTMKAGKDKAECAKDEACKIEKECKDKASEQAQQNRKKWWKFWGSDEKAAE